MENQDPKVNISDLMAELEKDLLKIFKNLDQAHINLEEKLKLKEPKPTKSECPKLKKDTKGGLNICFHCKTQESCAWRRAEEQIVCNSCGLYFKKHKTHRPLAPTKITAKVHQQETQNAKKSVEHQELYVIKLMNTSVTD